MATHKSDTYPNSDTFLVKKMSLFEYVKDFGNIYIYKY